MNRPMRFPPKVGRARSKPVGYKQGGTVKKTGQALVHKGEKVLTAKQARTMPLAKLERKLK